MKLLICMLSVLLIGCGQQETLVEYSEPEVTVETSIDVWEYGRYGDKEIKAQYSINNDRVFGKYEYDNESHIFVGYGENNVFRGDIDETPMLFYVEEKTLYGVNLDDHRLFYVSDYAVDDRVSYEASRVEGIYQLPTNSFYEGKKIHIHVLLDHLILVTIRTYNNEIISDAKYLGTRIEEGFWLPEIDEKLILTENHELILGDSTYYEHIQIAEPSLIDLGIARNEKDEAMILEILGTYLDKVIESGFRIEEKDNQLVLGNGQVKIIRNSHFSIWLDKKLTGETEHLILTNDLFFKSDTWKGKLVQIPVVLSGYKTKLFGSLDDYLLEGYFVRDQVGGDFDSDGLDDLVLVLDSSEGEHQVLIVLLRDGDGFKLSLLTDQAIDRDLVNYEDLIFDNNQFTLSVSYKENHLIHEKFIFNASDYRLIKIIRTEYDNSSKQDIIYEYNMNNYDVTITGQGSYTKRVKEQLYLYNYNGQYNKDYE